MHPILLQFGSLSIYTYGILVALAFLLGSWWITRRARDTGETPEAYWQVIIWIMVAGFAGARLLYVIYYPDIYLKQPLQILLDRGGLVWYGGLSAATLAGIGFAWIDKKMNLLKMGDIIAPPATLGLAIGRIGCFMSGCCYGRPANVPWAVQFPPGHETHPLYLHPTQLYETGALILLTIFLAWLYRRQSAQGVTMCAWLIGSGLIRFVIELYRGDVIYWVDHLLTASQVFSLLGVILGLAGLAYCLRKTQVPLVKG